MKRASIVLRKMHLCECYFTNKFSHVPAFTNKFALRPWWWWSSGQRACLLFRRSEFELCRVYSFNLKN